MSVRNAKFWWREIDWKTDFWPSQLLPGVNTAPAHSHTAPVHPHLCPCPPAATTDWPCIRPCFFFYSKVIWFSLWVIENLNVIWINLPSSRSIPSRILQLVVAQYPRIWNSPNSTSSRNVLNGRRHIRTPSLMVNLWVIRKESYDENKGQIHSKSFE